MKRANSNSSLVYLEAMVVTTASKRLAPLLSILHLAFASSTLHCAASSQRLLRKLQGQAGLLESQNP